MSILPTSNPMDVFDQWMREAKATPSIKEPTAMAVATTGAGDLHVRVVLCKQWGDEGFTFFTNYDSRKGRELGQNPRVAAVFYWDPLFRQVKVTGDVLKISREDSIAYWRTRPRESQLSQHISKQSQVATSREQMERELHEASVKFNGQEVPCPDHWGGYLIVPKSMELWIGRPGRFHERHEFTKVGSGWTYRLLYP